MIWQIQSPVSIEDETDSSRVVFIGTQDGRGGVPLGFGVFVEKRSVSQCDSNAAEVPFGVFGAGDAVSRQNMQLLGSFVGRRFSLFFLLLLFDVRSAVFEKSRDDGAAADHVARVLVTMGAKVETNGDGSKRSARRKRVCVSARSQRFNHRRVALVRLRRGVRRRNAETTFGSGGLGLDLIAVGAGSNFGKGGGESVGQFVRQMAHLFAVVTVGVVGTQIEFQRTPTLFELATWRGMKKRK